MSFLIEIPKRSRHCQKGEEPFTKGMEYFALLKKDEEGNYVRCDYCKKCFEELNVTDQPYWKGKVSDQDILPENDLAREDLALECLREAINKDTKEDREDAFILSLYLVRKKILAFRQTLTKLEGSKIFLYEVLENEELLAVPEVAYSTINVKEVQSRVAMKLNKSL